MFLILIFFTFIFFIYCFHSTIYIHTNPVINAQNRVGATAQATVDLMALEKRKQAMETIEVCVQCGKDFKESENPFGGCKYHSTHSTYSSKSLSLYIYRYIHL